MSKSPRSFRFVVTISALIAFTTVGLAANWSSIRALSYISSNEATIEASSQGITAPAPPLIAAGTCDAVPAGNIEVEGTITGTTPVAYVTLGAAFTAINNGVHTGAISIDVCGDTNELAATATLNASGAGAASYNSISMVPAGGASRTISGATTAGSPMIDLNGADNVTIDGLNTGGNSLTISNTTVSATSGTGTIRFTTDATNNTITNASILGSATMAVGTNGGNISFASAAITTGNDNNTVSNCNLGPAGANLPTKVLHFSGTSNTDPGTANSGITITNNNIFDYFSATVSSAGIDLNSGTVGTTISNNRFYQSATRTMTATGLTHSGIRISNSSGNAYQITGNTIGFATNAGTGTYGLVFPTTTTGAFIPINVSVNVTTATNITNNTVAGIAVSGGASGTSTSAPFRAIYVSTGLAVANNNTIGSQSATGSITYTSNSASASDVMGIFNFGSSNWTTNNNTVGGITAGNSSTGAANIYGLRTNTGSTVTWTCANNTIGGTVANSINSTSTATGTTVQGIKNDNPIGTFTGNTIRNMTVAGGTGTTTSASMIGMVVTTTASNQTISQNTIFNLANTNATAATIVTGIQFTGSTTNVVERNFIHSLTTATNSAAAELNGIRVGGGTTTYRNNMIAIGAGVANAIGAAATNSSTAGINGINEFLGTDSFFHNSVYIGGAPTAGTGASYAFNGTQTVNTRSFRDNVFFNARSNSGATGKNYAVKINGTTPNPTGLTINNNVYFANGTGAVFGFFNSLDVANLAAWKVAVGQDTGSFESNPQYNDPTNATPDLHIHPINATVIEANGVDVGVTNDFDGQTRSGLTPVDIGADAGNFNGVDLSAPGINYTAFLNTSSTANRVLSVTITDNTSVATGGLAPRIYFNKNAGTYFSTACSLSSGTTQNGVWNCTIDNSLVGGVVITDVIRYFVVAQDTLGNLAANPSGGFTGTDVNTVITPPATPNQYNIVNAVSGTLNVDGVGGGGNFASLTNAGGVFEFINNNEVTGNITINISADLPGEIGTNALNEFASPHTILIKPSGAPRAVTGTNTGALIRLNGADRVTFDGSTTGATATGVGGNAAIRELTIQNTNVGTSAVVVSFGSGANGAQNDTIRNVNILGQDPTTTLAGIALGGTTPGTAGTDNDNDRVENCSIKRSIYGIYSAGASLANQNSGTVITMNETSSVAADRVRRVGIVVFNDNGGQFTLNSLNGISTNESADGIGIGIGTQAIDTTSTTAGGITNALVARNRINGVASLSTTGFSAAGITVAGAAGGSNTIVNNMITGVTAPSTSPDIPAGIYVVGATGSSTRLLANSIAMTGDRGVVAAQTPSFGVAITGIDPTVELKNNIFYTTQIASGGGVDAKSYAIGMVTTTFANLDSNYNDFFSSGANAGFFRSGSLTAAAGTDYATLALWRTATGGTANDDFNSIETDPTYVDPLTDLHVPAGSPVVNAGIDLRPTVTNDFDGNPRPAGTAGEIGADELTDGVTPDTSINTGAPGTPTNPTTDTNATFTFSGTDSITAPEVIANFECALDTPTFTTCVSPQSYTGLSVGSHTFQVRASDTAGNVDLTPATFTWLINPLNAPPTITPVGVTRQEGSPSSSSTIANVTDDGGNGAVTVTVNGGASATVNGVTVSNIQNSGGTVTADVVAACGAVSPATFTLTASDGVLSTNATLTVTVNPNTAPTVTYNNVTTAYLTNTTNPTATATDNGSIASYALQSQGTYTGGISVNPTSGLVTFTNPTAGGTITIRSTDNCGLFTDSTFTVTVGAAPVFTINDVTLNEGNSGTTSFTFTVTKTGTTGGNATVDYATAPGTATSPSDYTAITTTTLTFLPAETTKTITVLVNGDTLYENTEDFFVNLTNPGSATIGDNQGLGTITNDDTAPTISITDVTQAEGNSGATTFGFTVSLSAVSGLPTTVHYQTADGTATTADSDYVAVGDTTLTIPAGQLSVTEGGGPPSNVQVQVNGDTVYENNETFFVNLSNPTNATIADNQGVGTINNDDGAPSYSIDDVSHLEGDSGTTSYVFTVTRTGPTAIASAVTATTADNSATIADNDYQSNTATLNFAASASATSTQTFTVLANGDTVVEPNETFFVNLTVPTGGAVISDAQGIGTITNDDAVPVVQFSSQAYYEDESQVAVITINRTGDTSGSSTVTYATSGGSATGGAACGGNVDYVSIAPTPVTFTAGQTTKTFNVTVCGDTIGEYPIDETVGLTLAAVTNASVGTSATLNINDTASQYLQSAASSPAEAPHAPIDMTLAQNASPYPSQIVVAGAPTLIGSMRVTLYDVWHLQPDNIDVLLVGPQGQKYLLMADVGGTVTPIPENSPVTITFNDLVSAHLPDAGPLTTGQWQPTVCESNSPFLGVSGPYVTPGCASPNTAAQSMFGVPGTGFGNTNPNGTWMLYVRDDGGSFRPVGAETFSGSIKGGWGLEFIAPTAAELSISGRVTTADGRGITNAVVTVSGGSLVSPITVIAGRNGAYSIGGLTAGETYIVSVRSRRFAFANPTRLVTLTDNVTDADFTADR